MPKKHSSSSSQFTWLTRLRMNCGNSMIIGINDGRTKGREERNPSELISMLKHSRSSSYFPSRKERIEFKGWIDSSFSSDLSQVICLSNKSCV